MMAAVAAASVGAGDDGGSAVKVTLFEKNFYLGAKVLLSGGGRCNLTTGISDIKKVLENYPRGAKFLRTAMYGFGPEKVCEWFENHGVRLKTEEDLRVFPASDNGKDVVAVLQNEMKRLGVEVKTSAQVIAVEKMENGFEIKTREGSSFMADKVVLTTGGSAYRQTGSSGDGYRFAVSLGHSITALAPSLSSFLIEGDDLPAGVSFKNVGLALKIGGHEFRRTGPCLFTHNGLTGPAVFALSSMAAYETVSADSPAVLNIDFFPDEKDLEKRLLKLFDEHGKKRLVNIMDILLPHSFCGVFLQKCMLGFDVSGGKIDRMQRKIILKNLKEFEIKAVGRAAGDEFVTAGGVKLEEIDHKTMESKIVPGLYFAGEIMDVDGFTGGFNLQAAWATGRLAGDNASFSA